MNIALLTDGIWPYVIGGMQKHSFYLCKYLAKHNVSVDLYYTGHEIKKNELNDIFNHDEIKFIKLVFVPSIKPFYFPGHYLWEKYKYSKHLSEALLPLRKKYDIIYAQGFSGWHLLINKTKLNCPAPMILNFHGLNMFQKVSNIRNRLDQILFRPFVKKLLFKADYVQSLGGKLTQLLYDLGLDKKKIVEFGTGVDGKWLRDNEKNSSTVRTFVFVGRYDKIKGISEIYSAIKNLWSKYPFKFIFVGPFPNAQKLSFNNVTYPGVIKSETDLKLILDNSDFLVLPSYSEGMPTVIIEAMARKCAIIATNVGAVSELVSSENGILVPPSNSDSLTGAILRGIQMDENELKIKQQNSFDKVRRSFIWENLSSKMISFFNSIRE